MNPLPLLIYYKMSPCSEQIVRDILYKVFSELKIIKESKQLSSDPDMCKTFLGPFSFPDLTDSKHVLFREPPTRRTYLHHPFTNQAEWGHSCIVLHLLLVHFNVGFKALSQAANSSSSFQ